MPKPDDLVEIVFTADDMEHMAGICKIRGWQPTVALAVLVACQVTEGVVSFADETEAAVRERVASVLEDFAGKVRNGFPLDNTKFEVYLN